MIILQAGKRNFMTGDEKMSFGQNLQFLRRMSRGMTQEELAERLGVSRQTVSKWESDAAFPEMEKALALAKLFSCSLDDLLMGDMGTVDDAYSNLRVETLPAMRYVEYAVISLDPETDAIAHVEGWAKGAGIEKPRIIGWDFPFVSQEQINVYHMHGYAAACVLPEGFEPQGVEVKHQAEKKYAVITITDPMSNPFVSIPNGYKTLMRYMEINGIAHRESREWIACFEHEYDVEGVHCMDVHIAAE